MAPDHADARGDRTTPAEGAIRDLADAARRGATDALALLHVALTLPPVRDDGDEPILSVATTRARAFVQRVARGLTITRITRFTDDHPITVTPPRRSRAGADDPRPTSGGDCRTRTQSPGPMDGRLGPPDDRRSRASDGRGPRADPARKPSSKDEV